MKNDLKKFTKNCSIGLPGGPNEIKVSMNGYKKDSPDRFNNMNVIPSGNITMKDVNHPVYGLDEYGNQQIMMPDGEYTFPGNYVTEIPLKQDGGPVEDLYAQAASLIEEGNDPNEVMQFLVEGLMPHMEEQEAIQTAEEMIGSIMGQGEQQMAQEQQIDPNMQFAQDGANVIQTINKDHPEYQNYLNFKYQTPEELNNQKYYGSGMKLMKNKYGNTNYHKENYDTRLQDYKQDIHSGKKDVAVYMDAEGNIVGAAGPNHASGSKNLFDSYKRAWELNKQNKREGLGYDKVKWNAFNDPDAKASFQDGGQSNDFVDMELTDAEIESYRQQGYTIEEL